ncbi:porin [Trinickia terrae]|uniref:Porin n=1 Tax=Trinickia terrae TaxID=2571161 RepID=A0A4U1IDA9_9BURK|nr:porin [Trinickia terrae]TKC91634.1 porin [Trinickia terrae]
MKKSLLALAALSTFAGVAHAQSNVTLYGIVDEGLVYTNNVATSSGHSSLTQLASGNESGSRWGLTGAEDLGGGLKAIFKLENGFNANNGTLGQGGREFGRQAWVGLNSGFGTLTLGRQYNAVQDYLAPLDVASVLTQFATHPYDNDNLNNTFRTDNSVKYATPLIAGFQAEALYAFSNSTNFANNRAYSVGATYSMGPMALGAGYARAQNPGANGGALVGNVATAASTGTSSPYGSSFGTRVDQWGIGGTYAFGPATVGLLYTGSLFTNATNKLILGGAAGSLHFNNYEASLRYQLAPALVLALGETYTTLHEAGNSGHYLQTSAGADYNLSKRTDVYLNAFYQKTSSNLVANIDAAGGAASGTSQVAATVGIRHKF